jgi:hypothetical protein
LLLYREESSKGDKELDHDEREHGGAPVSFP